MKQNRGRVEYASASGHESTSGGQIATHDLLESGFKRKAIFAAQDLMALRELKELREH